MKWCLHELEWFSDFSGPATAAETGAAAATAKALCFWCGEAEGCTMGWWWVSVMFSRRPWSRWWGCSVLGMRNWALEGLWKLWLWTWGPLSTLWEGEWAGPPAEWWGWWARWAGGLVVRVAVVRRFLMLTTSGA